MGIENLNLNELFKNLFEDKNQDGIPDIFEQKTTNIDNNIQININKKIYFNDEEYNSIDELPPEAKEKFQRALQKMQLLKEKMGSSSFTMTSTVVNNNTKQSAESFNSSKTKTTKNFDFSNYTDEDTVNKNKTLLGISKKGLYAILIIGILFVVWWLKYQKK